MWLQISDTSDQRSHDWLFGTCVSWRPYDIWRSGFQELPVNNHAIVIMCLIFWHMCCHEIAFSRLLMVSLLTLSFSRPYRASLLKFSSFCYPYVRHGFWYSLPFPAHTGHGFWYSFPFPAHGFMFMVSETLYLFFPIQSMASETLPFHAHNRHGFWNPPLSPPRYAYILWHFMSYGLTDWLTHSHTHTFLALLVS